MDFSGYLKKMVEADASDMYLSTGAVPSMKVHGVLRPMSEERLMPDMVRQVAEAIMDEAQQEEFEQSSEMNLAVSQRGLGRFRVNIFKQRGQVSMVVRHIKIGIPGLDELGLPPILKKLVLQKRGLVLFVGGTGSGKSTSVASLLDYRNTNTAGHIVTIEDPIEFVHQHKKSIVNQREVGIDTLTYEDALKNTLRQAPDVIFVGEIRDRLTMEHAIAFAETGHLTISTLHANNANQALERIVNLFPEEMHRRVMMDLSLNLRGIVSQRLVQGHQQKRVLAVEILLGTPRVADLIMKGDIHGLKEAMEKTAHVGMQTFDNALYELYKQGKITVEEALRNADSRNNLRLKISLEENKRDGEGLSLQPTGEDTMFDKDNPFL